MKRLAILLLVIGLPMTSAKAKSKGIEPALLAKARAGDAGAEYDVGYFYERGRSVPRSYSEARLWYRRAAGQGNAEAQYRLGTLYFKGLGVVQDYAQALKWWEQAADQQHATAQLLLGHSYEYGRGVPQDFIQAASWYQKAAEQGDEIAENSLGLLYEDGKGVVQSYVEAYFWMNLAAATMDGRWDGGKLRNDFVKDRDRIAANLSQAQLSQVQERTRTWFAAHQPSTR